MKTIQVTTYSISELSDSAKQRAIHNYRNNNDYFAWQEENRESMEKFADIFPIKIRDWSYGGRGEGVNFYFTCDDPIEELTGLRLAKYIWNNYKDQIFKPKWYNMGKLGLTDHPIKHKRVKSRQITSNCPNKGKYSNDYYSAISKDNCCVLTGYCMDDELLNPIYKFLEKPDNRNFKELLEDCFEAWIKACNADVEWQNSDEYIEEEIEANEYEFLENGERF